jgi:hypothetical protein
MNNFTKYDIAWCRQMFRSLNVGGVWCVPRSGLVFVKGPEPLVMKLQEKMPWAEGMPLDAEELREFQRDDFNVIKFAFKQAGIEVRDSLDILTLGE